jgi:hypothetical protein
VAGFMFVTLYGSNPRMVRTPAGGRGGHHAGGFSRDACWLIAGIS